MPISRPQLWGLIGIITGCALTIGGAMILLVTLIEPRAKQFFLPAAVQMTLGAIGVVAGILSWRQNTTAKYIIVGVAVGVAANILFVLTIFARLIAADFH